MRARFTQHLAQMLRQSVQRRAHRARNSEQIYSPAGRHAAEHKAPEAAVPYSEGKDEERGGRREAEQRVKRRGKGAGGRSPEHPAEVVGKPQRRPGEKRIARLERLFRY